MEFVYKMQVHDSAEDEHNITSTCMLPQYIKSAYAVLLKHTQKVLYFILSGISLWSVTWKSETASFLYDGWKAMGKK